MVARIVTGKQITGAVNYNEEKVRAGTAELIFAENYWNGAEDLSYQDRLSRLVDLAKKNERTRTNCVHVSLNFDPTEVLSSKKLIRIAQAYMEKLGMAEQPYLLYRHFDAAHPHVHLVTTNIQANGIRIPLHYIGRDKSEPIRKEIEKKFGLIPAGGRGKELEPFLRPVDLQKAVYGKTETKKAISNIVRTVVRSYHFTSLPELNAVLKGFNIAADRGAPDSRMFEKKGLVYCLLDKRGEKVGVPIKSSSIYTRPTLAKLEERFAVGKQKREPFKKPLRLLIDTVLQRPLKDTKALCKALAKEGVDAIFRESSGRTYGVTFVDHRSQTVFKGSDLGDEYSASKLVARISATGSGAQTLSAAENNLAEQYLESVDFSKGPASALIDIYRRGMRLEYDDMGWLLLGSGASSVEAYARLSSKMKAYFELNHIRRPVVDQLNAFVDDLIKNGRALSSSLPGLTSILQDLLQRQAQDIAFYVPHKRKRRRRH